MGDFFISANELSERMARNAPQRVFDVRRHQALEPDSRFIPGSRWRNHIQTADWSQGLDRDVPIVLTCMHGHNVSQIAGARLRELGFESRVLAGGIEDWLERQLPSIGQTELLAFDADRPSQWVTRLGAKIDRVACPWLIRRFIDPDAQFVFVEPEWVLDVADELDAIAFDTPGAPIEHDGDRCS
ncbi:MAG: chromate resistance protein ChrB domain-containing protein, partial [Aestuariivirgaceae bacterium]